MVFDSESPRRHGKLTKVTEWKEMPISEMIFLSFLGALVFTFIFILFN